MALNLPSSHQVSWPIARRGAEAMGRPGVRRCTCRLPGAGQGGAREKKTEGTWDGSGMVVRNIG